MMRFHSFFGRRGGALGVLLLAAACGQKPAAIPNNGPTTQTKSDASASEKVSLTVYNKNFGLVREVRKVQLGTGNVELAYADVSAHIQPETVHGKSLTGDDAGTVLKNDDQIMSNESGSSASPEVPESVVQKTRLVGPLARAAAG